MSTGISSPGRVLVQYPAAGGFDVRIYPSKTSAAIQLLREVIRNTQSHQTIQEISEEITELLKAESKLLDDDE